MNNHRQGSRCEDVIWGFVEQQVKDKALMQQVLSVSESRKVRSL